MSRTLCVASGIVALALESLEQDFTLPDAEHWAVTEKADYTSGMMKAWLALPASTLEGS